MHVLYPKETKEETGTFSGLVYAAVYSCGQLGRCLSAAVGAGNASAHGSALSAELSAPAPLS